MPEHPKILSPVPGPYSFVTNTVVVKGEEVAPLKRDDSLGILAKTPAAGALWCCQRWPRNRFESTMVERIGQGLHFHVAVPDVLVLTGRGHLTF